MKEGWKVKKLGEVCEIYQPKTISTNALVENGKYLVYGANGVIGKYDQYNHTESELLMTCRGATCGTINISEPYSWINGNAMVIHPVEGNITMSYLKYVLRGIDLSNVITGAAQPQITRQSLSPLLIPIPPLLEQSRIVEELDLLSNIIEKKRQQLSELDNLAQSIFYDMFGDPVTNEKGFPLCTVGDIYKFQYGKGNKIPENKGEYLCYGSNGVVGYHTNYNSEDSPIIGHIGAYAGIVNWGKGKHFVTYNGVICKLKDDRFNPIYGYYMLKNQNYMEKVRGGAAQPFVSYDLLESPQAVIPPLDLQQLFAQKIETIEKQKALIKQSIAETEELFNSRMDYYFS